MTEYRLSITSAANREGLWEALDEIWLGADIASTGGALAKGFGPPPDWVVAAAQVVTITAGVYPTTQSIQALYRFIAGLRAKYPSAPPATLRITDGATDDTFELEGASQKTAERALNRWLDDHRAG